MASLRGYIDASVTNIEIDDTTSFPTNGGVVEVDTELIRYTYATDKAIINCERGYNGTTPATHDDKTLADLQDTAIPPYSLQEFSDVVAPVDHFTGVGVAFTGCRFTLLTNGSIFTNTGDETDPIWTLLQAGSDLGITQLTGDVTAGPGNGSQVATLADGVVTAAKIDSEAATVGQVLTADGAGAATWEDGSTAAASGPNGSVQLSDGAGNFTADPNLVFESGALEVTHITNKTDGSNLEIDETQGANIQIHNETGMGGTVQITSDVDLTLLSNSGAFRATATLGNVEIESTGGDTVFTNPSGNLRTGTVSGDVHLVGGNNVILQSTGNGLTNIQGRGDGYTELRLDGNGTYINFANQAGSTYNVQMADSGAGNPFVITTIADGTIPIRLQVDRDGAAKTWDFALDGSLTLPGDLNASSGDLSVNNIDLAQRMNVQIPGNFIAQSSVFTNLYLEGSTGIELIPTTGGIFISHSTGGADACAAMHFETSGQGVILPRMDTTTRDAIASPSAGLIIYNTTTNVLNFYNGSVWGAV